MLHSRLIDHFQNPRNVGQLAGPGVVAVEVSNPVCGDILRLSVRFAEGRVVEAGFQTRGCAASIASGSALTELVLGRSREELRAIRAGDVEEAVGELRAESKHAAALCLEAVKKLVLG